eukprot:scaffold253043_cov32-Tisochrysis_lutea.AAC.2
MGCSSGVGARCTPSGTSRRALDACEGGASAGLSLCLPRAPPFRTRARACDPPPRPTAVAG